MNMLKINLIPLSNISSRKNFARIKSGSRNIAPNLGEILFCKLPIFSKNNLVYKELSKTNPVPNFYPLWGAYCIKFQEHLNFEISTTPPWQPVCIDGTKCMGLLILSKRH